MTRRERVIAALEHRETDFIPYDVGCTAEAAKKLTDYFGQDSDLQARMNNHIMSVSSGLKAELKPGYVRDEYGVVWNRTVDQDIGVVENIQIPDYETRAYRLPPVEQDEIAARLEKLTKNKGDKFGVFNISFSLFERAWTLRGMENILTDMLLEPEALASLLDEITERNLLLIDQALACDAVDAIMFGDDWGSQRELLMGRAHWVKFLKPCLAKMYGRAKTGGRYVFQHSCGKIEAVFPDLIEIGLNCYQTFQPEIYDIEKVKREIGDKLTFWGGISTQQLLPVADAETVKSETVRIMKIMGKNGGDIAAPTHAMPKDIPLENMLAMLEVFQNQGKYLR